MRRRSKTSRRRMLLPSEITWMRLAEPTPNALRRWRVGRRPVMLESGKAAFGRAPSITDARSCGLNAVFAPRPQGLRRANGTVSRLAPLAKKQHPSALSIVSSFLSVGRPRSAGAAAPHNGVISNHCLVTCWPESGPLAPCSNRISKSVDKHDQRTNYRKGVHELWSKDEDGQKG